MISHHGRKQYHPIVPLTFGLALLPPEVYKQVPRSTRHDWRTRQAKQLFGQELATQQQQLADVFSAIAANRRLLRINKTLIHILAIQKFIRTHATAIRERRTAFLQTITRQVTLAAKNIGLQKTLSWAGISFALWRKWQQHTPCLLSPWQLCRRKHPAQLLNTEVSILTNACMNPAMAAWPLASIYHQLRRNGTLFCSLSSFYKYARIVSRPELPP